MGKIAFLFSGQGAQSVGMGKDIYENSANARALYEMGERYRAGVKATCFESEGAELTQTENAQPCLFLTALAFANELKNAGVQADAVAGFSLGEIPALAFSGVLSEADAFQLVCLRGETMRQAAEQNQGGMAAVLKLDAETVERVCEKHGVWAVNYNCPGQISCAGKTENLMGFSEEIKSLGGRAVKLAVSGAFHTPYMQEVRAALEKRLQDMQVQAPKITLYSNVTGEKYPADKESIVSLIGAQAASPVKWEKILRNLWADGVDTFIEVGAGTTLLGFVKRTLPEARAFGVTCVETLQTALQALQGAE